MAPRAHGPSRCARAPKVFGSPALGAGGRAIYRTGPLVAQPADLLLGERQSELELSPRAPSHGSNLPPRSARGSGQGQLSLRLGASDLGYQLDPADEHGEAEAAAHRRRLTHAVAGETGPS